MGLQKVERVRKFLVFEYDFATQGGTAGAKVMRNLDPLSTLEAGLIILDAFAIVKTAFVDADGMDAATLDIGDGDDADRFIDTSDLDAASAGDILPAEAAAKFSLLEANKITPTLTIGGGGVTAGKVQLYIEYVKPL
jgi:hypothetical protein